MGSIRVLIASSTVSTSLRVLSVSSIVSTSLRVLSVSSIVSISDFFYLYNSNSFPSR